MAKINVNNLLPEGSDGKRTLLPKQAEFLRRVLNDNPKDSEYNKYIAYISGLGGGKTLIGSIAMFLMAVKYPGDYMLCRQNLTDLKITTWKTLKEILPPELIIEENKSETYFKIRASGGESYLYGRGLEDFDKIKSTNLSGWLIDECDQVSEEAFTMLMGRLRGGGLRKGIVVSNPAGHNWTYRWWVKKDHIRDENIKKMFYLIRGSSLENKHLPDGYIESMLQTWSKEKIEREIMGSFDAFEGAVYDEFRRDIHVIKGFRIPEDWPRFIGIDHGFRNPAAWVWGAIGSDGEVYIYKEFYKSGWLINEIINGKKNATTGNPIEPGIMHLIKQDKYPNRAFIDPSTKARRGTTGESDFDEYYRLLPDTFPLYTAQNDVQLGIDRVKSYFKINPKTGKPNLYIFDSCVNLIEEITQYRWEELKPQQEGRKGEPERPKKVNDHAVDALRYIIVTLPEPYVNKEETDKNIKYNSLEYRLKQQLNQIHNPLPRDPFGG